MIFFKLVILAGHILPESICCDGA